MWNTVTKISKTYIANYLMKHLSGIMRSRPEVTAGLMITMRKSVPANRKSHSMRLFYKSGIKTIWGAKTEDGQLAAKILDEYMQDFQRRNLTLRVFSAHLHMDEATPHLHIDFIPYTTGSKRGLETRVSLKKALAELGFKGGTRSETERNQWVAAEKE